MYVCVLNLSLVFVGYITVHCAVCIGEVCCVGCVYVVSLCRVVCVGCLYDGLCVCMCVCW